MELKNVLNLLITSYNKFDCLAHIPKGSPNEKPLSFRKNFWSQHKTFLNVIILLLFSRIRIIISYIFAASLFCLVILLLSSMMII